MVYKIDPIHPDPQIIRKSAHIIREGGVVGIPTTGLYGLGADALNPKAVERIFQIKQRPPDMPILVLIHDRQMVDPLVRDIPKTGSMLMEKFWPGGLTIVMRATDHVPDFLTAGTGKIGIRCCRHPVPHALIQAVGIPITGTSANLSGQPGCFRVDQLDATVCRQLDMVLDAGTLKGGKGSTIVDVTTDPPHILREGAISKIEIYSILG